MKPNSPVSGVPGGRALATGWTVWPSPMGASAPEWTPPAAPADAPMTCALPMDVRTLLFRHGRCPDPRLDDASKASDWVVRHDWFFATAFEFAPPAGNGTRVFLRTRGVDDLAEFRLNGVTVGCTVSFNQLQYHDLTAALRADWTVTVTNAGPVPVLGVEIGCDDESEGRRFDWQPEENALVLLPGESRAIPVRALAHAGRELPQDLIPTLSAWNVAVIRPLHDPMNHPATENMRTER